MLRLLSILLVVLLVGCSGSPGATQTPTATPDPLDLVKEAAAKIRAADTFRISVDETGPEYQIFTDYATVLFRSAKAQYVAPNEMQADVSVIAAGLTIEVQVFSRGAQQWYRAIWTGNQWFNQAFAPDFNPESLISEDTGIEAALKSLLDLSYSGETQLENGADVYHLAATADGPDVAALLGGLIEPVGVVGVDVYIDRNTLYPSRFVITEHESPYAVTAEPGAPGSGGEADPVVWTIDVYDINAPAELSTPEVSATTQSVAPVLTPLGGNRPATGSATTPEATPEATATAETTPEAAP